MTRYRYFLLSSVLQFPYSFNVQQYRIFFAPKPSALPPLCPYIENPAAAHDWYGIIQGLIDWILVMVRIWIAIQKVLKEL